MGRPDSDSYNFVQFVSSPSPQLPSGAVWATNAAVTPGLLMPDDFTHDVFLSHSSKDKAVMRAFSLSASNGEISPVGYCTTVNSHTIQPKKPKKEDGKAVAREYAHICRLDASVTPNTEYLGASFGNGAWNAHAPR